MNEPIELLCTEPALAWKWTVNVLGKKADSPEAQLARAEVLEAPLVKALIATCNRQQSAYKKWDGAHWVLSILGDLGYPSGDEALRPLMEDTFNTWLDKEHETSHLRVIDGRVRRCASQEGYAIWCSLRLGFSDSRTDELVSRLLKWQWPDGGWNCDKNPEADTSSFMETLIPMRALALYAKVSGDTKVRDAAEHAAEVFLIRQLFKRRSDGQVINHHFVQLHYPLYWHYDILFGLKVLAEAGFQGDPRCQAALALLESKRLPDGGFPADESYARTNRPQLSGYSPISWGGTSKKAMNPFVTADVLYVLRMAGRLHVELPEAV
ncbi:MAG: hypothetical protein WCE68_14960 [Anaerolineales bacterium]